MSDRSTEEAREDGHTRFTHPQETIDLLKAGLLRAEEALQAYADPKNWGISRDDLNHRVVSWIGPGAEVAGLPDAPSLARAALSPKGQE